MESTIDTAETSVPEWLLYDDFEGGGLFSAMWNLIDGSSTDAGERAPVVELAPPRQTSRRAIHVQSDPTVSVVDVTTHHHFDWSAMFSAVRFWARAESSEDVELIVALTDLRSPRTFHQDQTEGMAWRIKRLRIGPAWRLHTVSFEELAPETPGQPVAVYGPGRGPEAGSELHFVAVPNQAFELWLDDVELRCRPESCRQVRLDHSP